VHEHYGGAEIKIDARIAVLIRACWANEIWTTESCQAITMSMASERPLLWPTAYITFESLADIQKFYQVLTADLTSDDEYTAGIGCECDWLLIDGYPDGLHGMVEFPARRIGQIAGKITGLAVVTEHRCIAALRF
jgi:hypothetical protein